MKIPGTYWGDHPRVEQLPQIAADGSINKYKPVFKIPRTIVPGTVLTWKGTVGSSLQTYVVAVSGSGIKLITPAGTFSNCIRLHRYVYRHKDGEQNAQTMILAPGRYDIARWKAKLEDTIETDTDSPVEAGKYQIKKYGNSNPPSIH